MESSDREILLEINGRVMKLESRVEKLETRAGVIEQRLDRIETRADVLLTSVYWIFAGLSLVIGLSTVFITLANRDKGASISDVIALMNWTQSRVLQAGEQNDR